MLRDADEWKNDYTFFTAVQYRSIANWHPDEQQWWITAFNAAPEEWLPDVDDLYVIARIDFEDAVDGYNTLVDLSDMYYDFKSSMEKTEYTKTNATIIFDDACHSVYIIWGESIDGETFAI